MRGGILQRPLAVAGQQFRNDEIGAAAQRLQQFAPVLIAGTQQRPAVQVEQIEGPELDLGAAAAVLHRVEAGHTGGVQNDGLAVEDHVMVGQIRGQGGELRIFGGDVATAAGSQPQRALVGLE